MYENITTEHSSPRRGIPLFRNREYSGKRHFLEAALEKKLTCGFDFIFLWNMY